MQMRHEHDAQLDRIERGDAFFDDRRLRAPHDAGAEVDEVRRAVDDDGRRGPRAIGIGGRIPGAEQDDARAAGRRRRRLALPVRYRRNHDHGKAHDSERQA